MLVTLGVTERLVEVARTVTGTSVSRWLALTVTFAVPAGPTECTMPVWLTVATSVSLERKVTGVPVSNAPFSSRTATASC